MIVRAARLDEILALRHAVLRPGRPLASASFDGDLDATTRHVAAFDGTQLVACATVMRRPFAGEDAAQLRGMATAAHRTRQGIGTAVLHYVEALMASEAVDLLWCNARTSAQRFYASQGWTAASDVFDIPDVGPHVQMTYRTR